MISILSPAKTLDMGNIPSGIAFTEPVFTREAAVLIDELRKYSPPDLERLMKINGTLAEVNFERYSKWKSKHSSSDSKQAVFAYAGAVYQGLDAATLDEKALLFAQDHLRIISGLYGVLRPLDLIHPYRLEMGIKLENPSGRDLYSYWKEKITEHLNAELEKQEVGTLVNLASSEYSSAIDRTRLKARVVTAVFKDYSRGDYRIVMVYAKRARGMMARFIAENAIDRPELIKDFNTEGYAFDGRLSSKDEFVFLRKEH
jgi:hypothetical protein